MYDAFVVRAQAGDTLGELELPEGSKFSSSSGFESHLGNTLTLPPNTEGMVTFLAPKEWGMNLPDQGMKGMEWYSATRIVTP